MSSIHNQWLPQQPLVCNLGETLEMVEHSQVSHALWDPIRTAYTLSHHWWQHLSSSLVSFYWSNHMMRANPCHKVRCSLRRHRQHPRSPWLYVACIWWWSSATQLGTLWRWTQTTATTHWPRIYRILTRKTWHSHKSPRVCHNFHQHVDDLEEDSMSLPRLPMNDIHSKVPCQQHICCFMAEIHWQVKQTTHPKPSMPSNCPINSPMSFSYPGHRGAHSRRDEWHHRCTFSLLQASVMGLTYRQSIPKLTQCSSLPNTAAAAYDNMVSCFMSKDHGHIWAANMKTLETQATAFTTWLAKMDFDDQSLLSMDALTTAGILCTYIEDHAENLKVKHDGVWKPASAQTIASYVSAASDWYSVILGLHILSSMPEQARSVNMMLPFVQEVIWQRANWEETKWQKKLPFNLTMYENATAKVAHLCSIDKRHFLGWLAAVHDWTVFGAFSGSRVGEYGQSKTNHNEYSHIPVSVDAGEWAGQPLAFISHDFTFWTDNGLQLSRSNLKHLLSRADKVWVRFRYDKSRNNHIIRKFRKMGHPILCPVKAAISILYRAQLLQVPLHEPIGMFHQQDRKACFKTGYTYLLNTDVTNEMHATCCHTYPDKDHYMNKNHKLIMVHSVCVTAAVALYNAGLPFDVIAFHLQWSAESVKHYVHECSGHHIGQLSDAVLLGAACAA